VAQTKTKSRRTTKGAKSKTGAAKRTGRAKAQSSAQKSASSAPSPTDAAANAAAAKVAALNGTRAAGKALAAAVERAKTPLIVGGAATAGVVGGLAIHRRNSRSRLGLNGLSGIPLPVRDGRLDLDAIAAAAHRAGSLGQQLHEIGNALEHAQKGRK
jgi:hypothetical protein